MESLVNSAYSADPISTSKGNPRHGTVRRAVIGWSLILLTTVLIGIAYVSAARSRHSMLGLKDPTSGYRIEYSVASRYHRKLVTNSDSDFGHNALEEWEFTPPAPTGAQRWIDRYLLHKKPTAALAGDTRAHTIRHTCFVGERHPGVATDENGYPTLIDLSEFGTVKSQRRLKLDGCPATWSVVDVSDSAGNAGVLRFYVLMIKPHNQPVIYSFVGIEDSAREPNEVYEELQEITASVHLHRANS